MAYKNKAHGDRLNRERAATYAAPRILPCPWCALKGYHGQLLALSEDKSRVECPRCHDARPATDDDRRVYGGAA